MNDAGDENELNEEDLKLIADAELRYQTNDSEQPISSY